MGPLHHYIELEYTSRHGRSDNTEWKKRMRFLLNIQGRLGFLSFNELDYLFDLFIDIHAYPRASKDESLAEFSDYMKKFDGKFIACVASPGSSGSYNYVVVNEIELNELKQSSNPPIQEHVASDYILQGYDLIREEVIRYRKWVDEDSPEVEYEGEE
jgi:hypothetical protein|tara:strand:- start:662 stop:1132 length:471 start_codon:yes stop_codon:yes gene_type:complete